ncbi:MAG: hypothetical protein ACOCU6_00425 [Nanoarchaeota archaeon]
MDGIELKKIFVVVFVLMMVLVVGAQGVSAKNEHAKIHCDGKGWFSPGEYPNTPCVVSSGNTFLLNQDYIDGEPEPDLWLFKNLTLEKDVTLRFLNNNTKCDPDHNCYAGRGENGNHGGGKDGDDGHGGAGGSLSGVANGGDGGHGAKDNNNEG